MHENFSDTELLQLIAKSDSSAFAFLYRKHFNMVKFLVEKNTGSSEDASDLFQEVLIIIYEKVRDRRLHLTCSLKTYIYSVARNQWLKKLSQKGRSVSENNFENYIQVEDFQEMSVVADLKNLLNEIGEACRKLLILFYYRKKSMEEICLELNYSNADSVKTQKYKCIQRLKKMIENKR
jgi:RNA polymerase sigma factor (sigma-70 family)